MPMIVHWISNPKTVVVIAPSYRVGFEGVSVADNHYYETPLGDLKIDQNKTPFFTPLFPTSAPRTQH
jgi:AmmeMemoRadiSam system protein B